MISQSATDQKKLSNIIVAGVVFTVLSVLVATLWGLFTYKQVLDMRAEYALLKDSVARLRYAPASVVIPAPDVAATATPITKATEKKAEEKKVPEPEKKVVPPVVAKAEPKIVTPTPKKANIPTVETAKKEEPKVVPTKGVVIWYYYRKGDNSSLQSALTTLGYVFQVKTLDNNNTGYQKSNCIWFGAGVPAAVVKKIAIAMIQSGTTLKGIRRFPQSRKKPSYKANVVEVGMDINLENYSSRPMSVVEVERAKSF